MDDVRKFMIIFGNTKNSVRSVPLTTGKRKKNESSGRRSASTTKKTKEILRFCVDRCRRNVLPLTIDGTQCKCHGVDTAVAVHLPFPSIDIDSN